MSETRSLRVFAVFLVAALPYHAVRAEEARVLTAATALEALVIQVPPAWHDPRTGQRFTTLNDGTVVSGTAGSTAVSITDPASGGVRRVGFFVDDDPDHNQGSVATVYFSHLDEAGGALAPTTARLTVDPAIPGVGRFEVRDGRSGQVYVVNYYTNTQIVEVLPASPLDPAPGPDDDGSNTTGLEGAAGALGGAALAGLLIVALIFLYTQDSPYRCTSAWWRFWNNCS
ncbi:MAG: hypothetical protein HY763_03160 [Planctomycetes bacterium]|nr:hypothetical protein [Planctomycetota bacterium]